MKINRLILPMAIVAIICQFPGAGQDLSSAEVSNEESVWHTYETPEDANLLVEEGSISGAQQGRSSLAIVDSLGKQSRTSLEIPSGSWARLSLVPGESGQMQLFCLYPTGSVATMHSSSAEKG